MTTEKEDQPQIKRYRVYLTGVASTVAEVEVDLTTLGEGVDPMEAALEAAHRESYVSLCHECVKNMNPPEEWIAGSWVPSPESLSENVEELT